MKKLKTFPAEIKSAMQSWWDGTYVPEPPGSPLFFGFTKKHWTSELAHTLCNFYLNHWKWVWGMAMTCATVYISLLRLNGCQ